MPRIRNLKINPDPVPLSAEQFKFEYTDLSGKSRQYTVRMRSSDKRSFHDYVFALLKAQKKNWIDWPALKKFNVIIESEGKDSVQEELPLKVAKRYLAQIV